MVALPKYAQLVRIRGWDVEYCERMNVRLSYLDLLKIYLHSNMRRGNIQSSFTILIACHWRALILHLADDSKSYCAKLQYAIHL